MEKLNIKLKNCFGIKSLDEEIDFSKKNVALIYAPNASMKTSFAKTFFAISKGEDPRDELYKLKSEYAIEIDDSKLVDKDKIFVVEALRGSNYQDTEAVSALLVNKDMKQRYDKIYKNIIDKKSELIKFIKRKSGTKIDTEDLLIKDFNSNKIFDVLIGMHKELEGFTGDFSDIKYSIIFNTAVEKIFTNPSVNENIKLYIKKYNEVISEYDFFELDGFNPVKAGKVFNVLEKESYFNPENTLNLVGEKNPLNKELFNSKLDEIRKKILTNSDLENISKSITANLNTLDFQSLIEKDPTILINMQESNLSKFKKELWKSYFVQNEDLLNDFADYYNKNIDELRNIEDEAQREGALWEKVIEIFKNRFHPPFEVLFENKKSVILGKRTLNMIFKFVNKTSGEELEFSRDSLDGLNILSQGEKRVVYLLYIIFEIKRRELLKKETLFIIDDIADSFDYENKYAIINYLRDISDNNLFYQIILTHNFDFFRTVFKRLLVDYDNAFFVNKEKENIKLNSIESFDIINPFKAFVQNYHSSDKKFITLIPFVREIVRYADCKECDLEALSNVLHYRQLGISMNFGDIEKIICKYIHKAPKLSNNKKQLYVIESIFSEADKINKQSGFNIEDKIILSIAIRLKAEKFIKESLNDKTLDNKGTYDLIKVFKSKCGRLIEEIIILDRVQIMTPENIHLNTFMYEPILDISTSRLIELYNEVKKLAKEKKK